MNKRQACNNRRLNDPKSDLSLGFYVRCNVRHCRRPIWQHKRETWLKIDLLSSFRSQLFISHSVRKQDGLVTKINISTLIRRMSVQIFCRFLRKTSRTDLCQIILREKANCYLLDPYLLQRVHSYLYVSTGSIHLFIEW